MRHTNLCLLVLAISWGAMPAANRSIAAPLPLGAFQSPVAGEAGPLSATSVLAGSAVTFSSTGFSGVLTSSVYTNDSGNPYGADRLTFSYEVRNSSMSDQWLRRFTIAGFAESLVDVSFESLTIEPINRSSFFLPALTGHYVKPSLADHVTADVIGFNFVSGFGHGGLRAGDRSYRLVIQTDATSFSAANASITAGSIAGIRSFAPTTSKFQPVVRAHPHGLPPRLAAGWVAQLAEGIEHAHRHGVLNLVRFGVLRAS